MTLLGWLGIFGAVFVGCLFAGLIVVWCVIASYQNRKGRRKK